MEHINSHLQSVPSGPVSHFVDIENLCGGDVATLCPAVWAEYVRKVGVHDHDQITVAANRHNAVPAFFTLPSAARRILVPNKPDAADRALVDAVDIDNLAEKCSTVVIASGDGYFAPLAKSLRAAGLRVVQVATSGAGFGVSTDLYVNCDELISLPHPRRPRIVCAARTRDHLRVSAASRRDRHAIMTRLSHAGAQASEAG